jgi:hypothetical protein
MKSQAIAHYFHGSATKLEVGDYLLPPRQTGARRYRDADRDAVYVSADLRYAIFIATDKKHPVRPVWVYQVEPIGELKPHITEIFWGFNGDSKRGAPICSGQLFTAAKARILTRFAVPAFFDTVRGDLIENYFNTHANLMTEKDQFRSKVICAEPDPDEPDVLLISRREQQWETFAPASWAWLQDREQQKQQQKQTKDDLLKRLGQFLDDRQEEIVEAAGEAPDVFRDLLRVMNFNFERCENCGDAMSERDLRLGRGLCLMCYAEQPD